MIKVNKSHVTIAGQLDTIIAEITVAIHSVVEEVLKIDEDDAKKVYADIATNLALVSLKIQEDHDIDLDSALEDRLKELNETEEEEEGCYISFKKRKEKKHD